MTNLLQSHSLPHNPQTNPQTNLETNPTTNLETNPTTNPETLQQIFYGSGPKASMVMGQQEEQINEGHVVEVNGDYECSIGDIIAEQSPQVTEQVRERKPPQQTHQESHCENVEEIKESNQQQINEEHAHVHQEGGQNRTTIEQGLEAQKEQSKDELINGHQKQDNPDKQDIPIQKTENVQPLKQEEQHHFEVANEQNKIEYKGKEQVTEQKQEKEEKQKKQEKEEKEEKEERQVVVDKQVVDRQTVEGRQVVEEREDKQAVQDRQVVVSRQAVEDKQVVIDTQVVENTQAFLDTQVVVDRQIVEGRQAVESKQAVEGKQAFLDTQVVEAVAQREDKQAVGDKQLDMQNREEGSKQIEDMRKEEEMRSGEVAQVRMNEEGLCEQIIQNQPQEERQVIQENVTQQQSQDVHEVAHQNEDKDKFDAISPQREQIGQQSIQMANETVEGQLQMISQVLIPQTSVTQISIIEQHPSTETHKLSMATLTEQLEGVRSPIKVIGKINRRNLIQPVHDKKVHEIVESLRKNDDRKAREVPFIPKKNLKRNCDLSKLDNRIELSSNVMSVTIGELFNQEDTERLISEIRELKNQLSAFERRHQQSDLKPASNQPIKQQQPTHENKELLKERYMLGKIINKSSLNNSRTSEKFVQSSKMIEPQPSRISSSVGFQANPQHQINKPGHFRIRSKVKQADRIQDEIDNKVQISPVFNSAPQKEPAIPPVLNLKVERGIRDQVEDQIVDLGEEIPNSFWKQKELTELANRTFLKFGVNIYEREDAVLSIKKYKNCVSFAFEPDKTILWYYEGKFYFGGWQLTKDGEGEKEGWGYDHVPQKYIYAGSFKGNKRQGQGFMKCLGLQNDVIYIGEWSNGLKHGFGRQIDADGIEYAGQWRDNKRTGHGKIKISPSELFEGEFQNDLKNGQGVETFKNCDVYNGNYLNSKFHGKGTYIWANTSSYEGDFQEGLREGHGTWKASSEQNCDNYVGIYRKDKKQGFGIYTWKDGTKYEGEFKNDLKHGEGIIKYGDGRIAKYQWREGNPIAQQKQQSQTAKPPSNIKVRRRTLPHDGKSKATKVSVKGEKR